MRFLKQFNGITNELYTVSKLNEKIKELLEEKFPLVSICGEISNFKIPSSNHYYFTLKDDKSQINAVIFANRNMYLKFMPKNGMKIKGVGRVGIYEPRGSYQIIFEHIEPYGLGELQAAFERLKRKLSEEGLFDEHFKKPIPFLPQKISVISSPTGAVIHDIQTVINRRYSNIHIEIVPAKMQGEGAEYEIAESIERLNEIDNTEVIILARGGGSLEDLFAFNTEIVARAIFASKIPVISAVGHETDYTISDFIADLRAPTPSAAAELAVPVKTELYHKTLTLQNSLYSVLLSIFEQKKNMISQYMARITDPRRKIDDLLLKNDDLLFRINIITKKILKVYRERFEWKNSRLDPKGLQKSIYDFKSKLYLFDLNSLINKNITHKKEWLEKISSQIKILDPEYILRLGYGIIRDIPDNRPIKSIKDIRIDDDISIKISDGFIECGVKNLKGI